MLRWGGLGWIACAAAAGAAFFAACGGTERRTTTRCADGFILTAGGCLPVPDRELPSPDSGSIMTRPDATPVDSGSQAPDAGIAEDSGTELPDAAGEPRPDAAPAIDLTGSWALRVVGVDTVESELLNTAESITVTTIMRAELAQMGTQVSMSTTICSIVSTPLAGYTTTYPQAAIAAFEARESIVTLASAEIGAPFVPTQRVQLLGWRALRDAATELLPVQDQDLRVVDADNDNEVGVTLEVVGPIDGQIYVAGRSILDLEGTIESNDSIRGLSAATREQNILDASNGLLAEESVTITRDPDPAKSTFELVRLPREMTPTCPEILAAGTALFP